MRGSLLTRKTDALHNLASTFMVHERLTGAENNLPDSFVIASQVVCKQS